MTGLEQTKMTTEVGHYYTKTREVIFVIQGWMWFRILLDSLIEVFNSLSNFKGGHNFLHGFTKLYITQHSQ